MMATDTEEAGQSARRAILSISIKDISVLHAAYMPFLENGGLFIPTSHHYQLHDEVFLFLTLMNETEKIPVAGKVVWITPKQPQGSRVPGIGIKFKDRNNEARKKIEDYLIGKIKPDQPTHTL